MKISAIVCAVLALGFANVATAGDAAAGEAKAASCAGCHGADGIATQPAYPNLAGQQVDYFILTMKAYKDGSRSDAMMKMFVASLSDEDFADLAAYYNSL